MYNSIGSSAGMAGKSATGSDEKKRPRRKPANGVLHEAVEPIKDKADIEAAKAWLISQKPRWCSHPTNLRNYMMFVLNINNAARISDLLRLRIQDVTLEDGTIRDELLIRESKTSKTRYLFFGPSCKKAISQYLEALPSYKPTDFLFASRNSGAGGESRPITRQMAWEIMSTMGKAISKSRACPLHLGTHSMRKTFGYQRIKANPNDAMIIAQVSEMYNHTNMNTTYRYLGFDKEAKRKLCVAYEL